MLSISPIKASQASALSEYYAKQLSEGKISREEALELSEAGFEAQGLDLDTSMGAQAYYSSEEAPDRLVDIRTGDSLDQSDLENHLAGRQFDGRTLLDPGLQSIEKLARSIDYNGPLDEQALGFLRSGLHPNDGSLLSESFNQEWAAKAATTAEVTSYDLTFSAPKGVSVIAAYSDSDTREALVKAHNEAIKEALDWAEEKGIMVARRGRDGAESIVATPQQIAAKTEFSSRAGDPHLHSHTLISAAAMGSDGRSSTLSGGHLFHGAATIGTVYEQRLAHKLSERFGLAFYTKDNRLREVAGFSDEVLERYSQRSQQIAETLGEMKAADNILRRKIEGDPHEYERLFALDSSGQTLTKAEQAKVADYRKYAAMIHGQSPSGLRTARQAANLASRVGKEESEAELFERWAQERPANGPAILDEVRAQAAHDSRSVDVAEVRSTIVDTALTNVTANQSSFTAKDLRKATTAAAHADMTAAEIDEAFYAALQDERVLALTDAPDQQIGDWVLAAKSQTLTTTDVLAQEENLRQLAEDLATGKAHQPMNIEEVLTASESANLTPEQEEMLAAATLTRSSLTVVRAPAGSGKTYSLAPVVAVHQDAGYEVVGLATAARTADSLREAHVNRTMSLTRFGMAMEGGKWEEGLSNEEVDRIRAAQQAIAAKTPGADESMQHILEEIEAAHPPLEADFRRVERQWNTAKRLPQGPERQQAMQEAVEASEALEARLGARSVPDTEKVVLVVDEAAMTNNDDLENVLSTAAGRGWKVILVGDERQLQGIGKSTGFEVVSRQSGAVELTTTYRARDEEERRLQEGWWSSTATPEGRETVDKYLDLQDSNGRLNIIDDAQMERWIEENPDASMPKDLAKSLAIDGIADAYVAAVEAGDDPKDLLAMAATRADSRRLGEAIQQRLVDSGHLDAETATEVVIDKPTKTMGVLHTGEQIRITRNSQPGKGETDRFQNGWIGQIQSFTADGDAVVLLPSGPGGSMKETTVPKAAIDDGVLTYGASTAHAAQGRTVEKAWLLADSRMEREALYPGLTRGKAENNLAYIPDVGLSRSEAKEALREQALKSGKDAPALDKALLRVSPGDVAKERRTMPFGSSDEEVRAAAMARKQSVAQGHAASRAEALRSTDEAQEALREAAKQRQEQRQRRQQGRGRAA
ncbi:hypothetical protein nbrc107696_32790 [Gordonia spumicola]|uniref:TrwC relaxase domain-containing protein n=1 Tax=Gordonia spumicola TaxID=589161 RepID=A0A7I9VCM2_9ACTN|nr:MobF family relaxase [Gordonia spumicola]GEE02833.1 hypothetical protein nbrc107696_32790 [Gordonia spumicola]